MHDTLANKGRVNYDDYSKDEVRKLEDVTGQFLKGEIDEIEQIDSLKMIREMFNIIRGEYKKKSQHIESLRRQIQENPEKFKHLLEGEKAEEKVEEKKEEA
jgi:hypothetical protein